MIEQIFAQNKTVEHKGRKIQIKQIALGDIPHVTKVISAFMKPGNMQSQALAILESESGFKDVVSVISRLTDLPQDEINRLSLDSALFIITEIVKENADFLHSKVAPQVQEMATAINGLIKSKS